MMKTQLLVVWSVGLVLLCLARLLAVKARVKIKARRLGCLPAPSYPHSLWGYWGYDLARKRRQAAKEGRFYAFNLELFDSYGSTWAENTTSGLFINTCESENIQTVGAFRPEDWNKDKKRSEVIRPVVGDGITFQDGPEWKHSRSLVRPLFKRAELSDVDSFETYVNRMLTLIPRDGRTVDLQPLLKRLFLDSSTYFIFGRSIDTLVDKTGFAREFLAAFDKTLEEVNRRTKQMGTLASYLRSKASDEAWKQNYSKIWAYVDREAADALARAEKPSDHSGRAGRYVLVDELAKEIKDPVALRSQLLHVWLPAIDSTSRALSHSLFYIARQPAIWTELRRRALELGDTPLTFETLQSLRFFRYTLFEGIRMKGPTGRLQRIAIRDTVLPRGGGRDGSAPVFVPKGTIVSLDNYPKYRDPNIWGDDVTTFRPGRFEGKILASWEFTPFFGGPRMCPAQQQVITQGVYLLVRLVREFESIENRDEVLEYVEQIRMSVESKNGVKVALQPAQQS